MGSYVMNPIMQKLLDAAVRAAVASFHGLEMNSHNLEHMGAYARDIVLDQVQAGAWLEWGIAGAHDLEGIACRFEVVTLQSTEDALSAVTLGNGVRVRETWDFARTPITARVHAEPGATT